MARPRAAGYEDQRAHILRSAAVLFAQRGFTAATMADLSRACAISKAALYHYFADKQTLLACIASGHVDRLEAEVSHVVGLGLPPAQHLQALIVHFMRAYAGSQAEHRVLTEDVKFLGAAPREAVEQAQRRVVAAFAEAIAAVRPDLPATLHKPLSMLLFGMINWTFTWLRPEGELDHEALAPLVVSLFLQGLEKMSVCNST